MKIELDRTVSSYFHGAGEETNELITPDNNDCEDKAAKLYQGDENADVSAEKENENRIDRDQREDEEIDDDEDNDNDQDEDEDDDEDDENDDEEEEDDDEEDENEDDDYEDDEQADSNEDILDPGQHYQYVQQITDDVDIDLIERDHLNATPQRAEVLGDLLDGERMLEVTRKLVRNTERDPDRDLRKQVLLKTAIKKLPQFMEYNSYSDSLDRSFHNSSMSAQTYYEHHDSEQKFYHSVQPNAIQMSTTSLRMLDLNDDHDPELGNVEQDHLSNQNLDYNSHKTSLDQHDYISQHHYDRYQNHHHERTQEVSNYETNSPISRHNSIDNLYQPINGSDMNDDMKDGDERIPIAFQIACEIYDFTCSPDDNERKLLDNLTNSYYAKPSKDTRIINGDSGIEDGIDSRDHDGSDTSSSSHSSSSDDCANSIVLQSPLSDENKDSSLLEASLNSSSDFYHMTPHDSGVALFSPRSNKRSSSSIGFDDDMDIDHLTELSSRSPSIGSNNQYKKLRKREIIE